MTQIDFHILPEDSLEARLFYVCRLVEKVSQLGHRVLILVDSMSVAEALDDLLWSFKPESFIPHQLLFSNEQGSDAQGLDEQVTVEISANPKELGQHKDVLINLHPTIPAEFSRFARVCEIVIQENNVLAATRDHYKFYKERGYAIQQHKR